MNQESALAAVKLTFDKKMLPLIPLMAFQALNMVGQASIYISFWVMIIEAAVDTKGNKVHQDMHENQKIAIALKTYPAFGVGQVLGTWPMGYI